MKFASRIVGGWVPILLLAGTPAAVEAVEQMTIEAAFSEEAMATERVPKVEWLQDGTALIYDEGLDAAQRTFQRLNPVTGKLRAALDMPAALKSAAGAGVAEPPGVLGWPLAFSASGTHAVYQWEGDYFVLELASATFTRVTDTAAAELQATFSPNGEMLAYVRDTDLYVYDLARHTVQRLTHDGSETLWNGKLSGNYVRDVFSGVDAYFKWSPDSAAIAYPQSDVSGVNELIYYDFKPYVPAIDHRERYAQVGEPIARVRVGIVEVGGGKTTWVSNIGVTDEYIQRPDWLIEYTMKMPADNPAGYEQTSRVLKADKLHGRLLLMHGLKDYNVRPQNAWAFADALVKAGIDFDMMIYPDEGHGISSPQAIVHRFNKMMKFWQGNL